MRVLFYIIMVIVLIISSIYLALLNPEQISLTLPIVGHLENVPLIVVVLSSMLSGVAISFVVMTFTEVFRSIGSLKDNRRQKLREIIKELYNQGLNLMSAGRTADAIVNFNKVISRDQKFVYGFVSLGDIYFSEGNYDKAIEYLMRAHLLKKDSIDILIKQEKVFECAKRPTEGISVLKKIIALDSTNLYAYIKIRQLFLQLENWNEALEVQKQILTLTKPGPQKKTEQKYLIGILYEIACEILKNKDYVEAIKEYRDIIKSNRDFVPAYLKLSETYQALGDSEEAIRVLEKANKQNPSYLYFPYLEELYLKKENPSGIIEAYKDAIKRSAGEVRLNLLLGKLYLKLEMLNEAMDQFQEILSKDYDSSSLHLMMGEVHERFRRYDAACEDYKKAIQIPAEVNEVLYTCNICNKQRSGWVDRCSHCYNWNTYQMDL